MSSTSKFSSIIIDDNPVNAAMASALLQRMGFEVKICLSGISGLKEIEDHPYDLILTDFQMPVFNGVDLTAAVRALETQLSRKSSVILAATAGCTAEMLQAFLDAGGNDYILKPASFDKLKACIRLHFDIGD